MASLESNARRDKRTVTDDTTNDTTHPYDRLTPDLMLDAVETTGVRCTGELLALNSYENRVYRIHTEDEGPLAAKFYRPGRWSREAILEEHGFALELAAQEIPVVAPRADDAGKTLHEYEGFWFAVFPWQPGRAPELNADNDYRILGRYLGRLHAVGSSKPFEHRPELTVENFGEQPSRYLLDSRFIPPHLEEAYSSLVELLLGQIRAAYAAAGAVHNIRLHGDCHLSNILWTDTGPHIVDLDDCRTGPAVQDLWMLLAGERHERERQLALVLEGYTEFQSFDVRELGLIEALRTLRLIHYSAWLAQRWEDPAFPIAFPWFDNNRYWEEHVLMLREQQAEMNEPALEWRRD